MRALAHELNNPLAVTLGFAQLLILNSNCPGKVRTDIEKLYSELHSIAGVAEKLHAYAISLSKVAESKEMPGITRIPQIKAC